MKYEQRTDPASFGNADAFASAGFGSPTPASGASEYTPSSIEAEYFEALWQVADAAKQGQLAGPAAVQFFMLSGLQKAVLKAVWSVADAKQQHFLTRREFTVAMRLIAMAQRGLTITASEFTRLGNTPLPLPRFTGLPVSANDPDPKRNGWTMSEEDRSKYEGLFPRYDINGEGFIHGKVRFRLRFRLRLRLRLRHCFRFRFLRWWREEPLFVVVLVLVRRAPQKVMSCHSHATLTRDAPWITD